MHTRSFARAAGVISGLLLGLMIVTTASSAQADSIGWGSAPVGGQTAGIVWD
jgi:hypothetical protein